MSPDAVGGAAWHEHLHRVVYRDTDQMGFVYHANHLVYFEIGRVEWLRARGWTYRSMEQAGVLIPLTDAAIRFHRPGRYDDLLRIRARPLRITRLRLDFEYEVHADERGEHLASGSTSHVFMDASGRPRRLSPATVEFLLTGAGAPQE